MAGRMSDPAGAIADWT